MPEAPSDGDRAAAQGVAVQASTEAPSVADHGPLEWPAGPIGSTATCLQRASPGPSLVDPARAVPLVHWPQPKRVGEWVSLQTNADQQTRQDL